MKFLIFILFIFSSSVNAEEISYQDFLNHKKTIISKYHIASKQCKNLELNAKEVCLAEADGEKEIATSELLADYKPTVKSREEALVTRAESNFKIELAKCNNDSVTNKKECQNAATEKKEKEIDHASNFWNRFNL